MLASPPFYIAVVQLPNANLPTPLEIWNSEKFYPFFSDALVAIDGTHIHCIPSAADRNLARSCKDILTQNCLAACSFDLCFLYFMSGWEGSTHNLVLFHHVCRTDLSIPEGKYYLTDARFASSDTLLVPYWSMWYHLAEWKHTNSTYSTLFIFLLYLTDVPFSLQNPRELFNLCHS